MPLALSLYMSFVLLLDMSFAKILIMILCHLLYHQIYHSLPVGYSTLPLTLATILVMVFCHLQYHQICHGYSFDMSQAIALSVLSDMTMVGGTEDTPPESRAGNDET